MLAQVTEASKVVSNSPLGETAVGWLLGVIVVFLMSVSLIIIWQVIIPSARQRRELESKKAESDTRTQETIAAATDAISHVIKSIDMRLDSHDRKFDMIIEQIKNITSHNNKE